MAWSAVSILVASLFFAILGNAAPINSISVAADTLLVSPQGWIEGNPLPIAWKWGVPNKMEDTYYIRDIYHWNEEDDDLKAMEDLFKALVVRLNQHLKLFSWGRDHVTQKAFVIINTSKIPQDNHIEKSIVEAGGPSIWIKPGPRAKEPTEIMAMDASLPTLAQAFPRPFFFANSLYQEEFFPEELFGELGMDAFYIGEICLGSNGVGKGCPNPCKAWGGKKAVCAPI